MIKIRREQLLVFEEKRYQQFEREMQAHLRQFAPRHVESLGQESLVEVIRLGFQQAASYGFVSRGPVRFYLEMMFLFGSYFDTDPQYPWAGQALGSGLATPEMVRSGDLHERAIRYIEAVRGPGNRFLFRALRRLRGLTSEPIPSAVDDVVSALAVSLQMVYPEKCDWLGVTGLKEVLSGGVSAASEEGLTSLAGQALFGILAFELGHRFASDPLYPWAASVLRSSATADANRRTERLKETAVMYLDGALRNAPGEESA